MHRWAPPFGPSALSSALRLGAESRLATYGSLRPGEQHHDLVADLELMGPGVVRGDVSDWEGYPVLSVRADGAPVPVLVFGGLSPTRWAELDAFEGLAYRRDLVIVELEGGGVLVATCYVAAAD
jgi:gamma-glutamylcyclotransferase (GGCT)/AIG2-like uncharacterized protein YtfP